MAYTSVKVIRFTLSNSINYILDQDKTMLIQNVYSGDNPEVNALLGENKLLRSVEYALNRDKTETTLFESAINCNIRTAYQDMIATKINFEKLNGVQGYHLVQSFKGQEASPELAHRIARELADRLIGDGFQAVISTHLNTGNIHNHIVFNSVNCFTGAKYHSNSKSYYTQVRRISDELCKKCGLSIIDPEQDSKGKAYAEWQDEKNGEPTYRSMIRAAIDEAIKESFTYQQFLHHLEDKGFEFKLDRKRPSIRFQGYERYARFDRMGIGYDLEDIKERIVNQSLDSIAEHYAQEDGRPKRPPRNHSVFHRTTLRSAFSMRGLRGLYFHYLYRMGVLPKKNGYQRKPSAYLQAEIRLLDKRIALYEYINRHGIETLQQLHAHKDAVERRIAPLLDERRPLYKATDGKARIAEINAQLKPLRKELALCRDIEQHAADIREKLRKQAALEKAQREEQPQLGLESALSRRKRSI